MININDHSVRSVNGYLIIKMKPYRHDFPSRKKRPAFPPSAARQRTEAKTPVKKSENVHTQLFVDASSRAEKDVTTFLQKLRDAAQPKPSRWVKITGPQYCVTVILIVKKTSQFWFSAT